MRDLTQLRPLTPDILLHGSRNRRTRALVEDGTDDAALIINLQAGTSDRAVRPGAGAERRSCSSSSSTTSMTLWRR
jgi:hypothetical protein